MARDAFSPGSCGSSRPHNESSGGIVPVSRLEDTSLRTDRHVNVSRRVEIMQARAHAYKDSMNWKMGNLVSSPSNALSLRSLPNTKHSHST